LTQIDDVWVFKMPLPYGKITELVDSAPILHLRFDDAHGATRFADDAAYGRFGACAAADACPATGEAVRGQIGLSAEFDGLDDRVLVADSETLRPASWTVGAWVMPTTAGLNPQLNPRRELVGKWGASPNVSTNFDLWIYDDLKPGLGWGCSTPRVELTSTSSLILNHWNHLMGTFDGKALNIYLNGVAAGSKPVPAGSTCTSGAAIEIAGHEGTQPPAYFTGRLDEVVLYKRALSAGEVRDLHRYQGGWFEDRRSRDIK
jgi:hypothetical protein